MNRIDFEILFNYIALLSTDPLLINISGNKTNLSGADQVYICI